MNEYSFYEKIKSWDYGYLNLKNSKRITGKHLNDFENYILIGNERFEKEKIGTCWDFTMYGADVFKNNFSYDYKLWYFMKDNADTHTWLSYKKDKDIKAFEVAWKDYSGIHSFDSERIMTDFYIGDTEEYFLINFNEFDCTGMTPSQFMLKILQSGQLYRGSEELYNEWLIKLKGDVLDE